MDYISIRTGITPGGGDLIGKLAAGIENIQVELKNMRSHQLEQQSGHNKVSASNTDHGTAIFKNLKITGNIKNTEVGVGPAAISSDLIATANDMLLSQQQQHEKVLVNLYTPSLMQVVREASSDLRLVNSEYFQWIRVMSGHRKSDLKPDLFSAYHPLVLFSPPYLNAPQCVEQRLFGKFASWECRSSIHCIWDAKWMIDMEGFGDKCKYLQIAGEDCKDYNGVAVKLKGVLFDTNQFWMIRSSGNTIVDVEICPWDQSGSKQRLVEFLTVRDPWLDAANALCEALEVTILDLSASENTAFLGAGANGRVFKLSSGAVIKIVVGKKSDKVEREYVLMVRYQKQKEIQELIFPVVENSYRSGTTAGVDYAGYILAQEGKPISFPISIKVKDALAEALYGLHSNGVIHGDPRIENALILNEAVKWIDFRDTDPVTTKVGIRRDVQILYQSVNGHDSSLEALTAAAIDAYVEDPTLERLRTILFKSYN